MASLDAYNPPPFQASTSSALEIPGPYFSTVEAKDAGVEYLKPFWLAKVNEGGAYVGTVAIQTIPIILLFFLTFSSELQAQKPWKGTGWCYFAENPNTNGYVPDTTRACEWAWDFVHKEAFYWDRDSVKWIEWVIPEFVDTDIDTVYLSGNDLIVIEDEKSFSIPLDQFLDDTDTTIPDTDIDTAYLSGNDLIIIEDEKSFTIPLDQFLDDTDTTIPDTDIDTAYLSGNDLVIMEDEKSFSIPLDQFLDDTDTTIPDTDIDTAYLSGNDLVIIEDEKSFTIPLDQFLDDTDTTIPDTDISSNSLIWNARALLSVLTEDGVNQAASQQFYDSLAINITTDNASERVYTITYFKTNGETVVDLITIPKATDTNTQASVSSLDNSVQIDTSTNGEGETNYDLQVNKADSLFNGEIDTTGLVGLMESLDTDTDTDVDSIKHSLPYALIQGVHTIPEPPLGFLSDFGYPTLYYPDVYTIYENGKAISDTVINYGAIHFAGYVTSGGDTTGYRLGMTRPDGMSRTLANIPIPVGIRNAQNICDSIIANTWFVSESGNNSNCREGTICLPCRDPWAAADKASPGDLIIVYPGDYSAGADGSGSTIEIPSDRANAHLNAVDSLSFYCYPGVKISSSNIATNNLGNLLYSTSGTTFSITGEAEIECVGLPTFTYCFENRGGNEYTTIKAKRLTTDGFFQRLDGKSTIELDELNANRIGFNVGDSDMVMKVKHLQIDHPSGASDSFSGWRIGDEFSSLPAKSQFDIWFGNINIDKYLANTSAYGTTDTTGTSGSVLSIPLLLDVLGVIDSSQVNVRVDNVRVNRNPSAAASIYAGGSQFPNQTLFRIASKSADSEVNISVGSAHLNANLVVFHRSYNATAGSGSTFTVNCENCQVWNSTAAWIRAVDSTQTYILKGNYSLYDEDGIGTWYDNNSDQYFLLGPIHIGGNWKIQNTGKTLLHHAATTDTFRPYLNRAAIQLNDTSLDFVRRWAGWNDPGFQVGVISSYLNSLTYNANWTEKISPIIRDNYLKF